MFDELNSEISRLLEKLDQYKGEGLSEAVTKSNFIDPMLVALEWEVFDFNDVEKEYPVFGGDHADYALKISGTPEVFIEAKKLDKTLDNDSSIKQLNNYVAGTGGVKWGILTNGNEYRLYKSDETQLHPPDRIVFKISIEECKDSDEKREFFLEMIQHLAKDKVESGELDGWASELFLENRIRKIMRDPNDEFLSMMKDQISTNASEEKVKAAMEKAVKKEIVLEDGRDEDEYEEGDGEQLGKTYWKKWHKEKRCSPKTWKWLERIIEIVQETVDMEELSWNQKTYVAYRIDNVIWSSIHTHKKRLGLSFKVPPDFFSAEQIADRLGIEVFDKSASFKEKFNLPSSVVIEKVNSKRNRIVLRIRDDFDLEQEEFRKFLQEAYDAFKKLY